MSLSIVVYLDPKSPLQNRHLLQGLKNQSLTPEVLLYHPQDVELPGWLPESWQRESVTQSNLAEIWGQGLSKASGEFIAFFASSALLHPDHFKAALHALQESERDVVSIQASFVDNELLPVNQARLPLPKAADWPGMCLGSRLLWPLESFVFRKQALSEDFFAKLVAVPSACDILEWIGQHAVEVLALETIQLPIERFWLNDMPEYRQTQVQYLLQNYSPEQLTPSYALPAGQTTAYLHYQSVCQALRNQGLWQYLEAFQQKQLKAAQGARTVMWLIYEDPSPWLPLLQGLISEGIYPTLVVATEQPGIQGSHYQVHYSQTGGLAYTEVYGIPLSERQPLLQSPPHLVNLVLELLHGQRPDRVHLTSLKLFSLYLPGLIEQSNTPLYYSLSDNSLLTYRQQLRWPETLAAQNKLTSAWADHQNQQAEHFLRHQAAAVLVHDAHNAQLLQDAGFAAEDYQLITEAKGLAQLYTRLPQIKRQAVYRSSLALMFEARTGQALSQQLLTEDYPRLQGSERVLTYGGEVEPVTRALLEARVWVEAALVEPSQLRQAKEAGLPAHLASPEQLTRQLHSYDALYTPYMLETMNSNQLRQMFSSAVMSLRKQGKWVIRLLNAKLLNADTFWLSEKVQRPYSPALIAHLLQQTGFEVSSQETSTTGWQDHVLEARLKDTSLPLLNISLATPELESYWESHPPAIALNEQDRVLLIGPHIFKNWMITRVQCEHMLAITTQVSELSKRQKRSNKFRFRHSNDLLKTLSLLKDHYDVIILQGVLETLNPEQNEKLIQLCHSHLNPQGRLHIQTLQLDTSQEDPLFWQSAANLRPYAELAPLLQQNGFNISYREASDQHLNYECLPGEALKPDTATPALPAAVKAVMQQAARVLPLEDYQALLKLQPASQACILAQDLLEKIPPSQLPQALQRIIQALEPDGAFVLTFQSTQDFKWQDTSSFRPYPEILVDKLLQDAGFQKRLLSRHSHRWVWCGFRRQNYQQPAYKPFRLRWEGDVLNYHSLAAVNRQLLKQLLKEEDYAVEIRNFSNPVFVPESDSEDYPLLQNAYKPLDGSTQLTVRHHWPPDFSMPQNSGHWVMIQPWEFGALPERWIYNMNKFVDQVWVPSEYVRQSYLKSGLLSEKVAVIANGVDTELYHPAAAPLVLETQKKFKFLFVGGGILRKGVDLLLNAFVETFNAEDDVCLVVKEFGAGKVYESVEIAEWIERYRNGHPEMPEILHLTEDLPPEQMPALYTSCDCLVHPFRGEGFALPIAEAMACERAVLVTAYGPTLEYCDDSNAYLIPAQEVPFKEKQIDNTLVTVDYPYWAEPDYDVLKAFLRHVYENQHEAHHKAIAARQTIVERLTWQHSLVQLEAQLEALQQRPVYRFYREQLLADLLAGAFESVEKQDFKPAVEIFQQALRVDPYQPSVCYNLGVAYLMLEDYPQALEYLTRSLREGEVTADLCYAMGTVLRQLGDYPTSQNFFAKARELDPSLFTA